MPLYVRIFTDALTDDKLLSVSSEAVVLWLRGLLYAKQHLTDGRIRDGAMTMIGAGLKSPEAAKSELVKAGLWVESDGYLGVPPDKWARYQTTRDQVEEDRAANKERQRRFREKRRENSEHQSIRAHSASDNGVTNAVVTPLHSAIGEQESHNPSTGDPIHPKQAERIYAVYPRRMAKDAAMPEIEFAIRKVQTEKCCDVAAAVMFLEARVRAYARSPCVRQGQAQYIPAPAKWFREGRYNDDEAAWNFTPQNGQPQEETSYERMKREGYFDGKEAE